MVDDGLAVPFDDGYRAWRAAVGEGWTVEAEAARRANRGKAPAAGRSRVAGSGAVGDRRSAVGASGAVAVRGAPAEGRARSSRRRPTGAGARPSTASCRASASGAASWSSRSGPRRSRRTSSRCAVSPASSRTSSGRSPRPRTPGSSSRSRRRDGGSAVTEAAGDPASRAHVHRAVRIGITGPIGCGKSQVARWLAELGAAVIDADDVARAVTAAGEPAHDAVVRALRARGDGAGRHPRSGRAGARSCSRIRTGSASSRRSSTRRSGPRILAARGGRRRRRGARRRHRGDQARRGRPGVAVRRGLAGDLRRRGRSASGSSPGARPPTTPIAGSPLRPGSPNASRRRPRA